MLAQKKSIIIQNVSSESRNKIKNFKNKNIIMVGSLINIKNHSFVINNFSKIVEKFPEWKLNIIGDGPLRYHLKKLIKKNGLSKNIFLIGNKKNVFKYLDKASIFLLSSISEGMNLSMIEAAKYGLPIISSNCSLSHKDIIIQKWFLFDIKFKEQFLNYLTILIKSEKKEKSLAKLQLSYQKNLIIKIY